MMSRPSSKFTISIIGAGVAGPVLALTILSNPTLRDLYTPILYDKLPSPEDGSDSSDSRSKLSYAAGAAVALTSNALFPLYELGLKNELNKISAETTSIKVWRSWSNGSHKWYNVIRNPGWTQDLETNLRVVERKDLQRILLCKIQQLDGEVVWNKELKEIQSQDDGPLKVLFDDGAEIETDLVVGCDGNWSSVRKHIIQQKGAEHVERSWAPDFPFCEGIYGISSKVQDAAVGGNGRGDTHWILLDEGVASTWALPDGKLFWTISIPQNNPPGRHSEQAPSGEGKQSLYGAEVTCGGYSFESTVELLRKHESVFHPVSGSFQDIFKHSERIVRAPLWHKAWEVDEIGNKNTVVIGDAARAMVPSSGQGACFAIEDATVFANCLLNNEASRDGKLQFEAAVSEYANLRVPRSKRMATQSYWTGVVGLAGRWWWRWLRDFGSSWLPLGGDPKVNPNSAKKDPMGWLYDVRFKVEPQQEPSRTDKRIEERG